MELTLHGSHVRIATGGKDHSDDSPAVVLIHGSGMDRTTWQMQSRWLAHHGYRVAAVDLPGHGLSGGKPLRTISAMSEWTNDLIAALDLAPAHVIGFSLGTFVALELAAHHPESVQSIVLVGTGSAMPVHPELLEASTNNIPRASGLMTSWGIGSRAHRGGHRSPGMWLIGGSRALLDRSPAGALAADMEAANAYVDAVQTAARVEVPISFVLGQEDKMTPAKSAPDLIDAAKTSRVVTLESTGHMMPLEAPIETRQAINDSIEWANSIGENRPTSS